LLYALFIWALYSFWSVVFCYNNIDQISLTLPEKVWQRALNFKTLLILTVPTATQATCGHI